MFNLRLWHTYLSVFVAPSILFFAFTGALQIFNLHEAGDGYQPPALIEKLGRVHKDQVFALDERREAPPQESTAPTPPPAEPAKAEHEDGPRPATVALKWFFLAAAVVLILSTSLGLWIALTHITRKRISALLLFLGALVPVVLLVV